MFEARRLLNTATMQRVIIRMACAFALCGCSASVPPAVSRAAPVDRAENAEAIYRAASSLHRKAGRTKDRADYRAAIAAYEELLASYTDSPRVYEANKFDGEARYAIEDWAGAALHYQRAIALDAHTKDAEELAYANVLATRYAAGLKDDDGDPRCSGEPTTAEPIPSDAAPILAAYDLYLQVASADEKTRATILFLKGRLLQSCAHFADAETISAMVVDHFPDSPEAAASAVLLLDCLAEQGKTSEIIARGKALDATLLGSDPILSDVLREIRTQVARSHSQHD
jgi:hypothetical protein